jgi:D-alanyl-D-alanine dipeptidase
MLSHEVEQSSQPPTPFMAELEQLTANYPELFVPIPTYLDDEGTYPNGSVDDWRGKKDPNHRIDIQDNGEPLVILSGQNPPIFTVSGYTDKLDNSAYIQEGGLEGAVLSSYLRLGSAEKLSRVQAALPPNYRLVVFDAYRSFETQMAAYNLCFNSIVDLLIDKGVLKTRDLSTEVSELISQETQKYISLASKDPKTPAPHSTGGPVDLGIVRIDDDFLEDLTRIEQLLAGETDLVRRAELNFELAALYRMNSTMLNFGTDFDYAGAEAGLTYYENDEAEEEVKQARRMLYNAMVAAGFEPYSEEWWHFNNGNQMAERTKWLRTGEKGVAVYGATELSAEQHALEDLHLIVFKDLIRAHEIIDKDEYQVPDALSHLGFNAMRLLDLSRKIGDPRATRSLGAPHDMKYRGDATELIQQVEQQLAA